MGDWSEVGYTQFAVNGVKRLKRPTWSFEQQWHDAAWRGCFHLEKVPSQIKRLLAERHTDPWALVLSFAENHLCLLYQSAKAPPI